MTKWQLLKCDKIIVRAWDSDGNTQPDQCTWNAMGMMNNATYKVQVEVIQDAKGERERECVSESERREEKARGERTVNERVRGERRESMTVRGERQREERERE